MRAIKIGLFEIGESLSRRDVYIVDCGIGIDPDVEERVRGSSWYDAITAYSIEGRVVAFFTPDRGFSLKEGGSLKMMGESAFVFQGTVDDLARYIADEELITDYEGNHPKVVGEEEIAV